MNRSFVVWIGLIIGFWALGISDAWGFRVGFAKRDITPTAPVPMWGYGARHGLTCNKTRDPLFAKVLVIEAGGSRMALIGLDIGRSPTFAMLEQMEREAKEKAGVAVILSVGSHTHHGPVIELLDEPGMGKGTYDAAVAYAQELPNTLVAAIVEASQNLVDAKMGIAIEETTFNRNRHSKREPKPRDAELAVVRFDSLDGTPIAIMVNFAAHPTIESIFNLHWSAEWPGQMQYRVEQMLNTNCFFMQGASGDMSPNTGENRRGIEGFGNAIGDKVVEMAQGIVTKVPETPSIKSRVDRFTGESRLDLDNRIIMGALKQAFFPELLALTVEMPNKQVTVRMDTVILNNELAIVGGSGELFSDLANRIKKRSPAKYTLVFGYCNGHSLYVPTLEAIEEGGYGADPTVAWCPTGTGEAMVEKAIENIREFLQQ